MCTEANISGCKTNHSLRATAATQMFQQDVPEKLIQERTGHRSLEGLRLYEWLCEPQHLSFISPMFFKFACTTCSNQRISSYENCAGKASITVHLKQSFS